MNFLPRCHCLLSSTLEASRQASHDLRIQGTGVEVFLSQPGLVQTPLNARKLDHSKVVAIGVDLATKVYGQSATRGSLCLQRPATDPNVAGVARFSVCCRTKSPSCAQLIQKGCCSPDVESLSCLYLTWKLHVQALCYHHNIALLAHAASRSCNLLEPLVPI